MTHQIKQARLDLAIEHVLKWEGGFRYVNDPDDAGGPTVAGVTIETWRLHGFDNDCDGDVDVDDLRKISFDQWLEIIRLQYWKPSGCEELESQLIADIILDYGWGSGVRTATRRVQRAMNEAFSAGLSVDGIAGPVTIRMINDHNEQEVARAIHNDRISFYYLIAGFDERGAPLHNAKARHLKNRKFLTGWHNRAVDLVRNRLHEPFDKGNANI